jgi:hypothetical protein
MSPKIHRNIQGAISNDDEDDVMMFSSNFFLENSPQNLTSFQWRHLPELRERCALDH